ncbi:zinc finger protein 266-like [Thrips palmi]|uniref:Zinc finger protein 266-like n=1 Tax=Thrips palmi TaxID=161013 RepID=A0A6P8Z8F5_THRPL|nr:zinc finger protein 266-like [Thrips palmi]XP_034243243.1 zinc finger protein 266-like [Thrips palmi]
MASAVDSFNKLPMCRDFCRLCLEEEDDQFFWDIFQAVDDAGVNLRLVEKIIACLDIMVLIDDGIPHKICGKCMTVVRSFFEFRKQCKLNDASLRRCFITANNENLHTERIGINNSSELSPRGVNESPKQCDQAAFPCTEGSNDSLSVTQDVSKAVQIPSIKQLEDEWSDDEPSATSTVFQGDSIELRLGETQDVSNAVQNPFLKQLEDEWSDDDHSATSTVLQEDTIMESPWRQEDLIAKGNGSCLVTSIGNLDPDKKLPEKCGIDSVTTAEERKEREVLESSDFISGQVSTDKNFIEKSVLMSTNEDSRNNQACQIEDKNMSAPNDGTSTLNETAAVAEEILGRRASRSVKGKWVCSTCNKNYTTLRALKKHILTHYSGQFICSECPASFENEEALSIHKAKHSTSSLYLGYSCEHCFKMYRLKSMLEQHITTEHMLPNDCVTIPGKFLEKCGKCGKNFSSSTEMEAHDDSCGDMSIHSEDDSSDAASIEHLTKSKECTLCKLNFENMPQLTFHLKKIHNIQPSFRCEVCAKVFDTYPKLSDHRSKVHIVKHSCEYCKKKFREKSKLRRHIKLHEEDQLYQCNLCSKSFRTIGTLQSHQKTHTKPFQCGDCTKKFRNRYQLNLHKNATHRGIKDFMCDRCGEKFICKTRLKQHVSNSMKHNLECDICGEMFCVKQKFQRHVKCHDSTNLYLCKKCDAKFLSSQGLCSHMRLQHPPL